MQQTGDEDPEFVRQRRAAIDTVLTDEVSKVQRFSRQDVMKSTNVAKCFQQTSQRMVTERPNTASASLSLSSVSNKPTPTASVSIKATTRCE